MIRRSSISIVVRIYPEVDGDGVTYNEVDKTHGVAIRADGGEQVVRFDGPDAAKQADLLVAACLMPAETHPRVRVQLVGMPVDASVYE
jgi:hypothetical protein